MPENSVSLQGGARWQKKVEKKLLVVRRPLKSEPLIRRTDSLSESTSGEAERGVERKTQRRWRSGGSETQDKEGDMLLRGDRGRQGGSEIAAEGIAVTGEAKERRGERDKK